MLCWANSRLIESRQHSHCRLIGNASDYVAVDVHAAAADTATAAAAAAGDGDGCGAAVHW